MLSHEYEIKAYGEFDSGYFSMLLFGGILVPWIAFYFGLKTKFQYFVYIIPVVLFGCASVSIYNGDISGGNEGLLLHWLEEELPENIGYVSLNNSIKYGVLAVEFSKISDLSFNITEAIFFLLGSLIRTIKKEESYDNIIREKQARWVYVPLITMFLLFFMLSYNISIYNIKFSDLFDSEIFSYIIVVVLLYLSVHSVPIYLVSSVVRREGVLFCKENYPEYAHIHEYLDYLYSGEQEIYVVTEKNITRWAFTRVVYKLYGISNPILDSSSFGKAGNSEDESKLIFTINKELAKIKLKHAGFIKYTYFFTIFPFLNFIYLFFLRSLYYQRLTFAYLKSSNFEIVLKAILTEENSSFPRGSEHVRIGERQMTIIQNALEIFSSKPSIHNQAKYIYSVSHLQKNRSIRIENTWLGYNLFSIRNKSS